MTSFIPSRWVFLAIFSIAALAVVAAWALSPMRVAHAEQPGEIELSITLANDLDGVVRAGDRVQVRAELRFLVEPEDRNGDGAYDIITHNELLRGQPLDSGRSWLRLSGGHAWDGSDSSASFQEQLQLNLRDEASGGSDLATVDASDLEDSIVATDGETIVFGAPNATVDGLSAAGAVYVLDRDGTLLARLTSPNAVAHARFGAAVAVDGETIVVGAPQEPTRYKNAAAVATVGGERVSHGGAVYVFVRPSRGWKSNSSPLATIVGHVDESRALPASRRAAVFARLRVGTSVAIDGDLLVVGVPGFSAYRVRSGGSPTPNATARPSCSPDRREAGRTSRQRTRPRCWSRRTAPITTSWARRSTSRRVAARSSRGRRVRTMAWAPRICSSGRAAVGAVSGR